MQLEILTNLATETNISTILREFQVGYYYLFYHAYILLIFVYLFNIYNTHVQCRCLEVFFCISMQTYVTSSDKEFAAATIQAIGRCASNISEITDACLNGLVSLLSNRDGM